MCLYWKNERIFKGSDSNFEVNICQILKVAINETSTLHQTICTWIALGNDNYYDHQVNRHDFLINFSLIVWYIDFVMTMYILMFMCDKSNVLLDSEMKVYYVT